MYNLPIFQVLLQVPLQAPIQIPLQFPLNFPLHVPHPAWDRRLLQLDCRKVLYHQAFQHYHHHDHPHHQCHCYCHCYTMRPNRLSHRHPPAM